MKDLRNILLEKLVINKNTKAVDERDPANNGKIIKTLRKSVNSPGLLNRTLEIYQLKKGYKGVLWNSGRTHWKSAPYTPLDIYKAKTIEEILDKFNFELKNEIN